MMQIDINELIELVKSVKSMFLNHTEAEHVTVKGRADFVTQVDIRVQEYMRNELSKRWPDVQFMGEEKDNSDIDFNGAVWILDPVDGTTNLIHDFKDSALSLGLCEQGQVTLGVIYQPFLDEISLIPISLKTGKIIKMDEIKTYDPIPKTYDEFLKFFSEVSKRIVLRNECIFEKLTFKKNEYDK